MLEQRRADLAKALQLGIKNPRSVQQYLMTVEENRCHAALAVMDEQRRSLEPLVKELRPWKTF